jgi:hypothetical protein
VAAVERDQENARRIYADYDEMARLGVEAARNDSKLREGLKAAHDMAMYAYQLGRLISGQGPAPTPQEIKEREQAQAQAKREEAERLQAERIAQREAERVARQAEAEERARQAEAESSAQALAAAQRVASDAQAQTNRFTGLDLGEDPSPSP